MHRRPTARLTSLSSAVASTASGSFASWPCRAFAVLLVERLDFCSGCSAAPSRMIHGGLRYLENGELSLVRESLRERDALLVNAAHMVRPLPTTVPIATVASGRLNAVAKFLGRDARPAARGAVPIQVGLALYDWMTRKRRILPGHRFRARAATRRQWPALSPPDSLLRDLLRRLDQLPRANGNRVDPRHRRGSPAKAWR